jgi:hypothetical protein
MPGPASGRVDRVKENDEITDADRRLLHAAIERSIMEIESDQTIPLHEALASLRRKRAARAEALR